MLLPLLSFRLRSDGTVSSEEFDLLWLAFAAKTESDKNGVFTLPAHHSDNAEKGFLCGRNSFHEFYQLKKRTTAATTTMSVSQNVVDRRERCTSHWTKYSTRHSSDCTRWNSNEGILSEFLRTSGSQSPSVDFLNNWSVNWLIGLKTTSFIAWVPNWLTEGLVEYTSDRSPN